MSPSSCRRPVRSSRKLGHTPAGGGAALTASRARPECFSSTGGSPWTVSSWAWAEGARGGLPALEWTAGPRTQSRGGGFPTRLASHLSAPSPEARGAFDPRDPAASPLGCLSLSPFCGTCSRGSGRVCCDLEPWGWSGDLDCQEESAGRREPRGSGQREGEPGGQATLAPRDGCPPDLRGTVCVFGEGAHWGRRSALKRSASCTRTAVCWGLCLCLFCGSSWGLV